MPSQIAQACIDVKRVLRHLNMPEQIVLPDQTAPEEKSDLCCYYLLS